jgi:putative ABC transport system permease protein
MRSVSDATRDLCRAPAFTGLVVVTLSLGIGVATAMFSVVDAVLINPLPFPTASRIVEVWTYYQQGASRAPGISSAMISALANEREIFEAVEAYQFDSGTMTGVGDPEQISFPAITPGLFSIFPVAPTVGRLFTEPDATGNEPVILISERLWTSRFARDPGVIDRQIAVDDRPYRIVGVLPPRFSFPEAATEVWKPLNAGPTAKPQRIFVVGLRRHGVSIERVTDRLKAVTSGLHEAGALAAGQYLVAETPIQITNGWRSATTLYLLLGAVAVLLLVACVNVSNLMLVRASMRHGELALKTALGADRATLLRGAVTESLLLAAAATLLALPIASGFLGSILGIAPPQLTFLSKASSGLDWRGLAFAVITAVVACVIFGVLPAWRVSRVDAIDALKQQSRTTAGRHDDWWQGALVAGQVALVVILLAGAGVLLRSFVKLNQVELGFRTDGIAVVDVQMPQRYMAPGLGIAFMRQVEARVEAELNARVTVAAAAPAPGFGIFVDVRPEAEGMAPPPGLLTLPQVRVSADFFDVLGIDIVEGRTFRPDDGDDVVIVNEVIARRFWANASPVGRRFKRNTTQPWTTVVGVARDIKSRGPADAVGEGTEVYYPFGPSADPRFLSVIVAAGDRQASSIDTVRRIIWEQDPKLPILDAGTMTDRVGESIARPRFVLILTVAFAASAVILACVGIYGVSAYWVASRRRQLAICLALGALPRQVVTAVVGRALGLAGIGAVAGLAIAISGAQIVESFLFAIDARDPITLVGTAVTMAAVATLACAWPAFRASRVDPITTLRAD